MIYLPLLLAAFDTATNNHKNLKAFWLRLLNADNAPIISNSFYTRQSTYIPQRSHIQAPPEFSIDKDPWIIDSQTIQLSRIRAMYPGQKL